MSYRKRNHVVFSVFTDLFLSLTLVLGGCGAPVHKVVTPDIEAQMLRDLQEGKMVLVGNNLNASFYFIGSWRSMADAYNAHHWKRLAILVMTTGHEIDIAYYFLGAAAEQLGYYEAALAYYDRAVDLYNDNVYDHHCRDLISVSGCPINLRRALPARIASVRNILQAQAVARAREEALQRQQEEEQARKARRQARQQAARHKNQPSRQEKAQTAAKPATAEPAPEAVQPTPLEPIRDIPVEAASPRTPARTTPAATAPEDKIPVQDKVRINMPDLKPDAPTPPSDAPVKTPAKKTPKTPSDDYS
ncbi:hypothetical protein [Solidesulfovibrio sp. C21]|uniref:hypothetical protein n=1 Tax=Solidesulfovibrio sp. C21 TaxID=3398613 RepID=UPI0039FCC602